MGCDIHIFAEVRKNGKWIKNEEKIFGPDYMGEYNYNPFDWRGYGMFGFLADVRNYSHSPVLAEPKGLPDDSEYLNTPLEKPSVFDYGYFHNGTAYTNKEYFEKDCDYHSKSWFTLKELLDYDYSTEFWNLRYSKTTVNSNGGSYTNGAEIGAPNDGNTTLTIMRDFLGECFFEDLETLKTLGTPEDVRIIFWFDN